jgi:Protein of unknown function (DUF4089)
MTDVEVLAYVKAGAALQGLSLDETHAKAVAVHLARTAHLALLLDDTPLAAEDELAELYKPLTFPSLLNFDNQL